MYTKAQYSVVNDNLQPDIIHFQTSDDQVKIFDSSQNELGTLRDLMFNGKALSNANIVNIKQTGVYIISSLTNSPATIEAGKTAILEAQAIGPNSKPTMVHFTLILQNGQIYHNTVVGTTASGWSSGGNKLKEEISQINTSLTNIKAQSDSNKTKLTTLEGNYTTLKNDLTNYKQHNHDDRYVRLNGGSMAGDLSLKSGNGFKFESAQGTKINMSSYTVTDGIQIGSSDTNLVVRSKGNLMHNSSKIWTESNDGKGSGLDADSIQGVNGNDIAQLTRTNSFKGDVRIIEGKSVVFQDDGVGSGVFWRGIKDGSTRASIRADASGRINFTTSGSQNTAIESNGAFTSNKPMYLDCSSNQVGVSFKLNNSDKGLMIYRNNSSKYLGFYNNAKDERMGYFDGATSHLYLDKAPEIQGRRLYMQSGKPSGTHKVGDIWIS